MMEVVSLIWHNVLIKPWFLIWISVVIAFYAIRRWLQIRKHASARTTQIEQLTPLANELGGTVVGPEGATAWSAGLQRPMERVLSGIDRIEQRSVPKFDLALDFQRGPWHVRVSEASVRKALAGNDAVQYEQEHRIEVATVRLAPMKILRPLRSGLSGPKSPKFMQKQRFEGWASEPPQTVEHEQCEWHHIALMPPMDEEFYVYGEDIAAAQRNLDADALKWLLSRQQGLPMMAQHMRLTIEAGIVYTTIADHIYPENILFVVDTIVGLLDRMPDMRPRHPAAAAL
ncbi:hypothetical protein [Lentzea sp. HUAS12]|uniref:hypothetical protein n=1 Tax=Lentzea sp. HUAS12 TaxID=2951806 RepID=UPI00209FC558|nr:hypothetical protein [Lentzea sp. HUAS12]USX49718.1 hypothetical protein ND450_30455 [Lentzea sp. HUAS12]